MSNEETKREKQKLERERKQKASEKYAAYFFDLSKLTFATWILGTIPSIINSDDEINWVLIGAGLIATGILALIGRNFLK